MGIKHLWNLLEPHRETKSLFHLKDRVVAIDLSGWVCESLNVVDYFVHPRFYLRNLFFRTYYLLQEGIIPVFVLDGAAPPLKYGVIVKRKQLQFRGARPMKKADCDKAGSSQCGNGHASNAVTAQKRIRFHHVLKECEELLSSMGLVCVQAPGEAEALCAYLNRDGLVYGVISQDSDCFAYGAIRVLKNFSASQKGGSVDIYDLQKLADMGQEKIVAMAILTGCDYCPNGIKGVGKELVKRFINNYSSKVILAQIRSWRATGNRLTDREAKAENKNICSDCGHSGKAYVHRRAGCRTCGTKILCHKSRWKIDRANIKSELDIKRKALNNPDFPPEAIMREFLERKCEVPPLNLDWRQPNIVKFVRNIANLLQWSEIYGFQKLFPLFTRWQLITLSKHPYRKLNVKIDPDYIKKKRSPKGVASFEIVWKDKGSIFSGLIPEYQLRAYVTQQGNTEESLWSTIEPQELISAVYPELVETFLASKGKPKRNPKTASKSAPKDVKSTKHRRFEELLNVVTQDEFSPYESDEDTEMVEPINSDKSPQPGTSVDPNVPAIADIDKSNSKESFSSSFFMDLIADGSKWDEDYQNLSDVVERVCHPDYGRVIPFPGEEEEDRRIRKWLSKIKAIKKLAAMSAQLTKEQCQDEDSTEPNMTQHRLLLKHDFSDEPIDTLNQSFLSGKPRKSKSYFFEPLVVPRPELQDDYDEMDMFECSVALKDQLVIPPLDDLDETIIYDLDF